MFKYLVALTCLTAAYSGVADGDSKDGGVTAKGFKREIVDSHRQIYGMLIKSIRRRPGCLSEMGLYLRIPLNSRS